jgi:predicted DNA-binding transcriptional regulator AlpA
MRNQHNKQSKPAEATEAKGKGRRLTFRELKTEKNVRESRMTIWRRIRDNQFPAPFEDHGRVYWWESEIDEHNAKLENLPRGCGRAPPPKKETT